jgi:hypothetical protein
MKKILSIIMMMLIIESQALGQLGFSSLASALISRSCDITLAGNDINQVGSNVNSAKAGAAEKEAVAHINDNSKSSDLEIIGWSYDILSGALPILCWQDLTNFLWLLYNLF